MRLLGKKSSDFLIFMQYFWVCWLARKNSYLGPPLTTYSRRRPEMYNVRAGMIWLPKLPVLY